MQYPETAAPFRRGSVNHVLAFLLALLVSATAAAAPPPVGLQRHDNRWSPAFVPVGLRDFEDPEADADLRAVGVVWIEGDGALEGARSARLEGASALVVPGPAVDLRPGTTYRVSFRYRNEVRAPGDASMVLGVEPDGTSEFLGVGGPVHDVYPDEGVFTYLFTTPETGAASLWLVGLDGGRVLVDDLRVRALLPRVAPAEPRPLTAPFPRLSNYNLDNALGTALRNGGSIVEVRERLARFDLVNGLNIDHMAKANDDVLELRASNPDLIALPYVLTTVAEVPPESASWPRTSLRRRMAEGLQDGWFMRDENGERLPEPLYPQNFQMNHTRLAPEAVRGAFPAYARDVLARSALPSGFWDGVHLDQAEWYPNPLLSDVAPFDPNTGGPLPAIDLDEDGVAEPRATLYAAWEAGYVDHVGALGRRFGNAVLLFGNAGAIPRKPSILGLMNGYQNEFTDPYARRPDGTWETASATGWYELLARYLTAQTYLRMPQIPSLQFTGIGLGESTGDTTDNGLPDRTQTLVDGDFRRARLGLGTVLLGNGFFGYDLIDNTTAPVWLDEYSIDAAGTATGDGSATDWLGQPLGPPRELPAAQELVLLIDFETDEVFLPEGFALSPAVEVSDAPDVVLAGARSGVLEVGARGVPESTLFAGTGAGLDPGHVYELRMEYRILAYEPEAYAGSLLAKIEDDFGDLDLEHDVAAVWYPDEGERGSLRVARRVDGPGYQPVVSMNEPGRVAFDDLRILRGAGGVFRRDFEGGIVLVNPTPEPRQVDPEAIAGPLGRTGLRRIAGTQAPVVNDGSAVTGPVTLPPGDALLLLADRVPAPAPGAVQAPAVVGETGTTLSLRWPEAEGTVAGYVIRYGLVGGDRTEFALSSFPAVTLAELEPGGAYQVDVAAFDHRGREGPRSPAVSEQLPGPVTVRPRVEAPPALVPGQILTLSGTDLADPGAAVTAPPFPTELGGTRVRVNGLPAPLIATGPDALTLVVPWAVNPDRPATLRVERGGVRGPAVRTQVAPAFPRLWTWGGADGPAIAVGPGRDRVVGAGEPVRPGDRVEVLASTLGDVYPRPDVGAAPADDAHAVQDLTIELGGSRVPATATPVPDGFGFWWVRFTVPEGVPAGLQPLALEAGGVRDAGAVLNVGAAGGP